MTADEIIQALESEIHQVDYVDGTYADGVDLELFKNALDLINRQKAEIERLKSADVAPVRHGQWEKELLKPKIGLYGYTCSNCNKLIHIGIERYMTYCGNCGAKMDGGVKENEQSSFNQHSAEMV